MHVSAHIDPALLDFVRALARADAARDIARLKERGESPPTRAAASGG